MRENLSQQELADRLGVARNYVYLIESGRKPISESIATKLSMLETGKIGSENNHCSIENFQNLEKRLSSIETLLIQLLAEVRSKK